MTYLCVSSAVVARQKIESFLKKVESRKDDKTHLFNVMHT